MEYKKLGNTNLQISTLGFGTMRLPIPQASGDFKEAIELIHHAADKGINFYDVGTFYCHYQCEKAFGKALEDIDDSIILSGKNSRHHSKQENWTGQLDNTLRMFDRHALDLYFIHYLDMDCWEQFFVNGNMVDEIGKAKKDGKLKHLGFSSHDTPENIRKLINTGQFDAVILSYNMINRTYEETIQYAHSKGLGVIIMNPLAGGMLRDTFLDQYELSDHFSGDITALALNYVLSNPYVDCVLSGMRSIEEIDLNIRTTEDPRYSEDELQLINAIISSKRNESMVHCTSCEYCMPCPQGINIPSLLQIWNQWNMIKGRNHFNRDYQMHDATADCCIQCGICEERCPNKIEVSSVMGKMAERFM